MSKFQAICKTRDVPEGTALMFVIEDQQIGIFHVGEKYFAIDNRCPHAAASLAHGIIKNETVTCRIHHWQFRLRDGVRVDETCPNSDVTCYPTKVVGDEIHVDLRSA